MCDISLDPGRAPDPSSMPTVALRADIDGLAMDDLTGAPYRSRTPGIAHACGHDVHTAVVLGAGLALLESRRSHPRDAVVRLIFEPAEEAVPGGAVGVIDEGGLAHVRSIFGVHCDPKLDVGTLGIRTGPLTSAADQFELTLSGPGGHTARPRQTVDLVRWTARIVERLWDEVQARLDSPVTLVFGAVHAGAAANVIPATATLRGSFRTADRPTWAAGERVIREALTELFAEQRHRPGAPVAPRLHDGAASRGERRPSRRSWSTGVVMREFGPQAVAETPQSMGGDSFAWYTEQVPGTYVRLGTHDPSSGCRPTGPALRHLRRRRARHRHRRPAPRRLRPRRPRLLTRRRGQRTTCRASRAAGPLE